MPSWLSRETLAAWWAVVIAAPHLSLMLIAVCLAAGYFAARWRFAGKAEHLEERLKLRDDEIADYKRKLDGATPDEARARLDRLEALVAPLHPRELTDRQALILTQHLGGFQGAEIEIGYAHSDRVCQAYADELRDVFRRMGWRVQVNMVMAPFRAGVGLFADLNPNQPTREAAALMQALAEAQIEFVPRGDEGRLVPRLLVFPRA